MTDNKQYPELPQKKALPDLMMASYHEAIGWNACVDAYRAMRAAEPAAVGGLSDENEALDLLEILFDAWENGTPCYEDPESYEEFIGHAFRLEDSVFHRCADLLNRRRSKHVAQPQETTPSQDAESIKHDPQAK